MRILYIYRNPKLGFSIEKVFNTLEKEISKYENIESIYLPCSNYKILSLYKNIKYLLQFIKGKNYDIIHITGTEHYLLPFLRKYNTVITVHDLGFYTREKKTFRLFLKYLLWIKTLKLAKYVTFISETSKKETLLLENIKKYTVIYNPIDSSFVENKKIFNTKCPIILHIGTKVNKNLINSIKAMSGLSCRLRIVGKLNEKQIETLDQYKINYSNVYNLTDDKILEEYINCDIVNFPSIYEGFGMPIIEAQAVGRIVITSNIEPMKTIANNAAIIVDPYCVESIKKGYIQALNFDFRILQKGLINAKNFEVSYIAHKYLDLYKTILTK